MKIKVLPLFVVVVLLMPFVVSAQTSVCSAGANAGNLGQCVSQIYLWSLGLSGILAVMVCVWGGYQVMTARGNAAQATTGRSYITSSIIGMVLLFAAYIILNTINPDLTNFSNLNLNAIQVPPTPGP